MSFCMIQPAAHVFLVSFQIVHLTDAPVSNRMRRRSQYDVRSTKEKQAWSLPVRSCMVYTKRRMPLVKLLIFVARSLHTYTLHHATPFPPMEAVPFRHDTRTRECGKQPVSIINYPTRLYCCMCPAARTYCITCADRGAGSHKWSYPSSMKATHHALQVLVPLLYNPHAFLSLPINNAFDNTLLRLPMRTPVM